MACHFPFTVILFEYQSLSVSLYIPAEPSYLNSDRRIKGKRAFFHLYFSLAGHISVRAAPLPPACHNSEHCEYHPCNQCKQHQEQFCHSKYQFQEHQYRL